MTTVWRGVRFVGLGLAIGVVALAILTRDPIDISPLAAPPPSGDGAPSSRTVGHGATPAPDRGAFLQRPLFDRSRRPVEAQTAVPGPDLPGGIRNGEKDHPIAALPEQVIEQAPPRLRLLGTRRFAGEIRALIAGIDEPSSPPSWLAEGALVGGWSIEAVTSGSVTLGSSGTSVDLHLHEAGR